MDHGPDIRFVDAHPERRGGYHHVQLARHEFFLHPAPALRVKAGVVAGHTKLACQGSASSSACLRVGV